MPEKFTKSNNSREHIQQELEAEGITHASDWQESLVDGYHDLTISKDAIKNISRNKESSFNEINNRAWQKQLDEAFVSEDYELIKTLKKVRPLAEPNKELISAKLNKLIVERPKNWLGLFRQIVDAVGKAEVDEALIAKEYGLLFNSIEDDKSFNELQNFGAINVYRSSFEMVANKYRDILFNYHRGSKDDLIHRVKSLTSFNPVPQIFQEVVAKGNLSEINEIASLLNIKVTSEIIQQAYEAKLEKGEFFDCREISGRNEKPSEDQIQRSYHLNTEDKYWINYVVSLQEATGVKPIFTANQLRPIFEKYFSDGRYIGVKNIIELFGIQPPNDLIEENVIKIIDKHSSANNYLDNGHNIKESLDKLMSSLNNNFKITDAIVQDYYQKLVAENKAYSIINLYDALAIQPIINKEQALDLVWNYVGSANKESINKLISIFEIKLKFNQDQIKLKYQEVLDNFYFDKAAVIQEITGVAPDKELVKEAIKNCIKEYSFGDRYHFYQNAIPKALKDFSVKIDDQDIISLYNSILLEGDTQRVFISRLNEIFECKIPASLVQNFYQAAVKTDSNWIRMLNLAEVYKLSGNIKPDLSNDEIKDISLGSLKEGLFDKIEWLTEVTGVIPKFTDNEIDLVCKEVAAKGYGERVADICQFTGFNWIPDKEATQSINSKINEYLEKLVYDNGRIPKSGLNQISGLLKASKMKIDEAQVQIMYQKIFSGQEYRVDDLNLIIESLGVKPVLPAEFIQKQIDELLATGKVNALDKFLNFYKVKFDSSQIILAYDGVLDNIIKHEDDWYDRVEKLYSMFDIVPSDSQLSKIFFNLIKDSHISNSRYDRITEIIKLLKKTFISNSFDITIVAQSVFRQLLADNNFNYLESLIKETKIIPLLSSTEVEKICSNLLIKGDYDNLNKIKKLLNWEVVLINPDILQKEYADLITNSTFKYGDKITLKFYELYELTLVKPEFFQEQIDLVYKKVLGDYSATDKIEQILEGAPSEKAIQDYFGSLLTSGFNEKAVLRCIEKYKISISLETIQKSVLNLLEVATLEKFSEFLNSVEDIVKISGLQVKLDVSLVEPQIERVLGGSYVDDKRNGYSVENILSWFERYTGQKPSQRIIDLVYYQTANNSAASFRKNENSVWSIINEKYGRPTDEVINRVYFNQLAAFDKSETSYNIRYVQFFGVRLPNLQKIAEAVSTTDNKISETDVEDKYQALLKKELLAGNVDEIDKLESLFLKKIIIEPADLQVWYTKALLSGNSKQAEIYNFLFNKTGIKPSQEIIDAKYRDIFINEFNPESVYNFQELCGCPPAQEMVQEKAKEILKNYIETDNSYQDDEGNWCDGDESHIFQEYIGLIEATGVAIKFDYDYAMNLYNYCICRPNLYSKLDVIEKETGFFVDYSFIQKYLLDNKKFHHSTPFEISEIQLDQHFSDISNRNLEEYKRIYNIFGCFDYYQKILSELEKNTDIESRQQTISILTVMGIKDLNKDDNYIATKEKLMSFIEDKQAPITRSLAISLSELAKKGDADLLNYFTSIIYNRSKLNRDYKEQEGVINLSQLQEIALRTLFYVNNSTANESLLSLLTLSDIDSRVRLLILNNLVTNKKGFFPSSMAEWAASELSNKKSDFPWDNLKYFQATNKVSSADLKRKMTSQLNRAFSDFKAKGLLPAEEQKINSSNIPDNIFLQIWEFTKGNPALLQQFDNLYKITKSSADRDALLFGIVNSLGMNKKTLQAAVDRLNGIELASPGNAKELGAVLKTLSFLDTVERELGEFGEEVLNILNEPVESLSNLNELLKEIAIKKIKEILPNEKIDISIIQNLWDHWGNLEPIFVYAGKMANNHYRTLKLVAEMVSNMDAPNYNQWKNWRYDVDKVNVQEQVGFMNKDQLEVWEDNHFAELGDIMIASTPSDKPKQIVKSLEEALSHGHVFSDQIDSSSRYKFIHEKMIHAYTMVNKHPNQREIIFDGLIVPLKSDIEKIDAVIRYNNLPKLEQLLGTFASGKEVAINANTKNNLTLFGQLLSKDQAREVENNYKAIESKKDEKADPLKILSAEYKTICEDKIEEIKAAYEKISQEKTLDNYNLDKEQLGDQKQLYQKRQELKALLDLYRVSALDIKRIATNRISDRIDKKGETLVTVIDSLKNYFKGNQAFLQDIENIRSVISQKEDLSSKRRLAMILTDNPQILFQVGKYPIGCGSCQNYEGSSDWNKSLAGYIADSHIKVAYLIDLNKLSNNLVQEIETQGFEKVKDLIPQQDLLEASVARAVTKIVKVADSNEPVLFIEPTYSSINKGDLGMDKYFNIFLELMVSDSMGIRLVRGGGSETVSVPNSCNPSGQYEDCAAGNAGQAGLGIRTGQYNMTARFIDRFTPLTDMDKQLAERISGVAY